MDNLTEKLKFALPEKDVPPEFNKLVKNAINQKGNEETSLSKSPKAYIFLIVAIVFIIVLLLKK